MPKDPSNFGEWLKIRRLAAEMTPVDVAKAIGMDPATYKELEAGRGGVTEAQIAALIRIEKMRVSRRDVDHARPTIVAGAAGEAAPADAGSPVTPQGAIAAIVASVQAKHARAAAEAAKPKNPLAAYLREKGAELGLSRLDLARRCRIAPTDLDAIEAGLIPGPVTLKAIAAGLGVEPAELSGLVEV